MKNRIVSVLITIASVAAMTGCAGEAEHETQAPVEAQLDASHTQKKGVIKVEPTWICIATSGTCPGGSQMMYCYYSGKEADGIFSCSDPAVP